MYWVVAKDGKYWNGEFFEADTFAQAAKHSSYIAAKLNFPTDDKVYFQCTELTNEGLWVRYKYLVTDHSVTLHAKSLIHSGNYVPFADRQQK